MANLYGSTRSWSGQLRAAGAALLCCAAGAASAGFITTNETGIDAIFSQTAFGSTPVDIQFNTGKTFANTALLDFNSALDFDALLTYSGYSAVRTVNMFFVDHISDCAGPGTSIIGCATTGASTITQNGTTLYDYVVVLDSSWAAKATSGAVLAAHELGHNLSLGHVDGTNTNLMNPILYGSSVLTASQVTTIMSSALVQSTGSSRYISITPIAVVASVPEPESWAMMLAGLLGMGAWVRRRKQQAA